MHLGGWVLAIGCIHGSGCGDDGTTSAEDVGTNADGATTSSPMGDSGAMTSTSEGEDDTGTAAQRPNWHEDIAPFVSETITASPGAMASSPGTKVYCRSVLALKRSRSGSRCSRTSTSKR